MDYKSALFLELSNFFYRNDFELILAKDQFRRNTENGFQNVILSVSQYDEEAYIQVNIGIRNNQVEDFVHQFTSYFIDFKEDSNTIILSIGKFLDTPQHKYKVSNETDLKKVSKEIEDFMNVAGFFFLERNSTLSALDRLINAEPEAPNKYFYNLLHGYLKGIIIAKLNQNPRFEQIAKIYQQNIIRNGFPTNQIENYAKLFNFLKSFSTN